MCFSALEDNANLFREQGVVNYTTMLLREDLDMLLVGAREAIYALDLTDISKKRASVRLFHLEAEPKSCFYSAFVDKVIGFNGNYYIDCHCMTKMLH